VKRASTGLCRCEVRQGLKILAVTLINSEGARCYGVSRQRSLLIVNLLRSLISDLRKKGCFYLISHLALWLTITASRPPTVS
jgi:hypothetical protein